jgi:Arc/MetJ family transcription regulator
MRTTIEIDEDLLRQAAAISGKHTKRAIVEEALREYVRQAELHRLADAMGTLSLDFSLEDLERMRDER